METSLRYGGDVKALRIHAKERFPVDSKTHLQVHAELDTKLGAATYFCAMLRHSYPDLLATLGVGIHFDKREPFRQKIHYRIRGKKEFPVTSDGLLRFNVKGLCDVDKEFKQRKSIAIAEFSWSIFNFQKDQDVRLKVGYEVIEKLPYFQIRENNWTLNANANGRWNVRFDL